MGILSNKNEVSSENSSSKEPHDFDYQLNFLSALVKKKGKVGAVRYLEKLLIDKPTDPRVLYQLGVAKLIVAGRKPDSEEIYRTRGAEDGLTFIKKAINLEPDNVNYKITYASSLVALNQNEEAVTIFQELFKDQKVLITQGQKYSIIEYAKALQKLGEYKKAVTSLQNSLILNDYESKISSAYIKSLEHLGELSELLKFYGFYEKRKGYDREVKYSLCNAYESFYEYKSAQNCFREMMEFERADKVFTTHLSQRFLALDNSIE